MPKKGETVNVVPGIQKGIDDYASNCPFCCKHQQQHPEPLMPSPLPNQPWEKIACSRLLFSLY